MTHTNNRPGDTAFAGGRYHGRIILPVEYPMKPPNIVMLTPNGRFEVGKKICLSFSAHHPESWQPAWGIRAMMLALIAFLPTKGEGAIAALDWTPEERKKCAESSKRWKCPDCGLLMSEALSETPTAVCLSAADKAAVAAMSAAGFAAPRSRTTSEASSAAAGAGGAATAGARSRTGSEALLETKEEETIAGAGAAAAAAGGSNNSGSLAAEAAKKLEAVVVARAAAEGGDSPPAATVAAAPAAAIVAAAPAAAATAATAVRATGAAAAADSASTKAAVAAAAAAAEAAAAAALAASLPGSRRQRRHVQTPAAGWGMSVIIFGIILSIVALLYRKWEKSQADH